MEWFLKHHVTVLTMECVQKAWKRNKSGAAAMQGEVVRLLNALDQWYRERWGEGRDGGEWEQAMEVLKKGIEKW